MAVSKSKKSRGDRVSPKKASGKDKDLPSNTLDSKAAPEALSGADPGAKVKNWAADIDSAAYKAAAKLYPLIVKAYENQQEQSDCIEEYWAIYNAQPDANLQYSGNSQGYVPAVRDCCNARTKRTLKQLFPVSHKHVDGISSDGATPYTQLSLLEHYIRKTQLKSTVRSDLIAGDVTGQWGLMIDWIKSKRSVTRLVRRNPIVEQIDGEDVSELGIENPLDEEEESTETEEVIEEGPEIVDFAVEDLAVIPPTCNDLQKARAVCLRLRLSKDRIEELVDEGVFILPEGTEIEEFVNGVRTPSGAAKRDRAKKQTHDAGVKTDGTNKHGLFFMAYTQLDLDEDRKESAITFYAGPDEIVGIIRNPLWSGKVPIISEPVERVKGSFFGKSKIEPVKFLQWQLCDMWNMGQDSAMYSMLPIFAVDPLKTPQWATGLVIGLGAIWPVAPGDVKPLTFPQLWKDSMQNCDAIKRQIWESMDVNEMMMGKTPAGRKNNQMMGQMQQEQATNIADHADRYEEVVLSPLAEMLFEFDQQFRTDEVTIESRGEIGVKASVESIPVQEWGEKIFFRWVGTAFERNMQRLQQQIAWMNVMKGVPPQMLAGRKLDLTPILEAVTENIFGPEVAPRILIDERNMFTVDPDIENEMLLNGFVVQVHEADDHQAHLQSHMRAANLLKADPNAQEHFKAHMALHMQAIQAKREREMAQAQAAKGGVPGSPGGGPPGAAGAPRPGAQPAPGGGRPAQNPPGAISADAMPGMPGMG